MECYPILIKRNTPYNFLEYLLKFSQEQTFFSPNKIVTKGKNKKVLQDIKNVPLIRPLTIKSNTQTPSVSITLLESSSVSTTPPNTLSVYTTPPNTPSSDKTLPNTFSAYTTPPNTRTFLEISYLFDGLQISLPGKSVSVR